MPKKKHAQLHVVLVAMRADGEPAGYGVMRSQTYEKWLAGKAEPQIRDAFGLLHGNSDLVDTFDSWQAAARHVAECDGEVGDVVACMAF